MSKEGYYEAMWRDEQEAGAQVRAERDALKAALASATQRHEAEMEVMWGERDEAEACMEAERTAHQAVNRASATIRERETARAEAAERSITVHVETLAEREAESARWQVECREQARRAEAAELALTGLREAVQPHLDYQTELRRRHGNMPSALERTACAALSAPTTALAARAEAGVLRRAAERADLSMTPLGPDVAKWLRALAADADARGRT